jgi:acetolactate synthase-1/2/3 large subunit
VISSYAAGRNGTGRYALPTVEASDVLLVVGSDLDNLAVCDGRWPQQHQSLIRIDVDVDVTISGCNVGLLGDARQVLAQLIHAIPSGGGSADRSWSREAAARAHEHACAVRAEDLTRPEPDGTVWPGALMGVLADVLGPGDIVATDASYSSAWAINGLPAGESGPRIVTPRSTGTLGWGLPAALGCAAASDGRVIGVVGDGGLAFSVGMLEVAVRAKLSVLLLLLNNGVYGSQRNSNVLAQGRDWDDLYLGTRTDYVGLASAYGWTGARANSVEIARSLIDEWRPSDGPMLVDIHVRPDARPPVLKYDPT